MQELKWYLTEQKQRKSIRMSYAQTHPRAGTFIAGSAECVKNRQQNSLYIPFCCYLLEVYIGAAPCII
jgi:hypothetical protein